jgi:hypothetical protein
LGVPTQASVLHPQLKGADVWKTALPGRSDWLIDRDGKLILPKCRNTQSECAREDPPQEAHSYAGTISWPSSHGAASREGNSERHVVVRGACARRTYVSIRFCCGDGIRYCSAYSCSVGGWLEVDCLLRNAYEREARSCSFPSDLRSIHHADRSVDSKGRPSLLSRIFPDGWPGKQCQTVGTNARPQRVSQACQDGYQNRRRRGVEAHPRVLSTRACRMVDDHGKMKRLLTCSPTNENGKC